MLQDKDYNFEPLELINQAIYHVDLFLYASKSNNINIQIASHFNLHLAFELTLKGYLIFINHSFSETSRLKKLKHNLKSINNEISKINKEKGVKINALIKEYFFLNKKSDELRYYRVGDKMFINNSYSSLLGFIYDIKNEVSNSNIQSE